MACEEVREEESAGLKMEPHGVFKEVTKQCTNKDHYQSESAGSPGRLWVVVRCFIGAIFGHSYGPGAAPGPGDTVLTI